MVIAVSARMSDCTTSCSSCTGQGMATRKNKTGKAKCRDHGAPPARCSAQSEMTTATSDIVQLISRQSGFATAIRRAGNKMAAANSAILIVRPREPRRRRRGPANPALIKQPAGEKRHRPPVAVLRIERPLALELENNFQPEKEERDHRERDRPAKHHSAPAPRVSRAGATAMEWDMLNFLAVRAPRRHLRRAMRARL